jgi:hypothetical protein
MKENTYYISGPMTGIVDFNYPLFEKVENYLISQGHKVLSPHKAPKLNGWEEYMRHDIKLLCDCGYMVMLPGWELSRGACVEKYIAESIGIFILSAKINGDKITIED